MKKINEIIERYKHNLSEKDIQSLYGDFGSFIISEYKKKLILTSDQVVFTQNVETLKYEKDSLKLQIYEDYINGTSEKDIHTKYGDYSSFYLKNLKLFLISIIPEF